MNINLNSFSHYAISLGGNLLSHLRKEILPFLVTQHKKIAIIASLALGCLATYYLKKRVRTHKVVRNLNANQKNKQEVQPSHIEPENPQKASKEDENKTNQQNEDQINISKKENAESEKSTVNNSAKEEKRTPLELKKKEVDAIPSEKSSQPLPTYKAYLMSSMDTPPVSVQKFKDLIAKMFAEKAKIEFETCADPKKSMKSGVLPFIFNNQQFVLASIGLALLYNRCSKNLIAIFFISF